MGFLKIQLVAKYQKLKETKKNFEKTKNENYEQCHGAEKYLKGILRDFLTSFLLQNLLQNLNGDPSETIKKILQKTHTAEEKSKTLQSRPV